MPFSQHTITEHNTSPRDLVAWMRRERLLVSRLVCPHCRLAMNVQNSARMKLDGVRMRCWKCKRVRSVRQGSWFASHPRLSLVQCLRLGVAYNFDATIEATAQQWEISVNTVSTVFAEWRAKICTHVDGIIARDREPFTGCPVEVDCATFKHIKDTVNDVEIPILHVQGILEPYTDTFRYRIVPDQKAPTLRPHISALVPIGTVIMTDEHKSYQTLPTDGYWHYRVNHNQDDYAHEDRDPRGHRFIVTTNHLESLWASVRRRLHNPMFHTLERLHQALKETVFLAGQGDVWSLFKL